MNKLDFLRRLDKELSVLEKEERREILAFYEERFYNGTIYENKTEEEVIAELERPEAIARNVLEEYGVSPRTVKVKEERYSNVSPIKAILLICFDVFIAAGVIPALFSAAVAIIGSSFTWFTTIGIILGNPSAVDQYVFGFTTAAFILLFLFGLVVLEAALWVTRTLIKWHLNVFKMKNRQKYIKTLSHWSLDSWFKKHRGARKVKNLFLLGALVGIVYTGFWIFNHYDWVVAEYQPDDVQSDVITEDFTQEIANGDVWDIETDLENIKVELVVVSGEDFIVKHHYNEDDKFQYEFDSENNVLTISNDTDLGINFFFDPTDIFRLFNDPNILRIEVPEGLVLENVTLKTSNSSVYVRNNDFDDLKVNTSNSTVTVINVNVANDVSLKTTNGKIAISDSTITDSLLLVSSNNMVEVTSVTVGGSLQVDTSNGRVEIREVTGGENLVITTSNSRISVIDTLFESYDLNTSNGAVNLQILNTALEPASSVKVDTSNNKVDLENVYALYVDVKTTNGNIDYQNDDNSFHPNSLTLNTSSTNSVITNVSD